MRTVSDKIAVSSALGGWGGYITRVVNPDVYHVISASPHDIDEGEQLVQEVDIDSSLQAASFANGDNISLYDKSGTIVADNGDKTYDVEVDVVLNQHLTVTRQHKNVPLWRIAIENEVT